MSRMGADGDGASSTLEALVRGAAQGAAAGGASRHGIAAAVAAAIRTARESGSAKMASPDHLFTINQELAELATLHGLSHIGGLKRRLREIDHHNLAQKIGKMSKARNLLAHPPGCGEALLVAVREALRVKGKDTDKVASDMVSESAVEGLCSEDEGYGCDIAPTLVEKQRKVDTVENEGEIAEKEKPQIFADAEVIDKQFGPKTVAGDVAEKVIAETDKPEMTVNMVTHVARYSGKGTGIDKQRFVKPGGVNVSSTSKNTSVYGMHDETVINELKEFAKTVDINMDRWMAQAARDDRQGCPDDG